MSKSTWIAAVVFAALLAAAWVTLREKPERGITHLSFANVDPAEVTRIVATGKHSYTLERSGDSSESPWVTADGRPADEGAVQRLVDSIPKIDSSTVVTQTPQRFAELEVDEEGGTTIEAYAGGRSVARFIAGKSARGGLHVRDGSSVYVVRGVYPPTFERDAEAWVQKRLFPLGPDSIDHVGVRLADGTTYGLVAQGGQWALEDPSVLPEGFRFDPQQARGLARSLATARAQDVLVEDPGPETTGLDADVDVFTLANEGGEPRTLTLGKTGDDDRVFARASGWTHVVTLPAHVARNLRKHPTDFRDLTVMTIEPADVTRIAIRDGDRSLAFIRDSSDAPWQLEQSTEKEPEGFELDQGKVSARLVALASTRAMALAAPGAEADFSAPAAELTATTGDGETMSLLVAGEVEHDGKKGVLARGNTDSDTYVLSAHTRENLTGGLETFRKTAEPPGHPALDPAALQNLPPEVRAQLLRQMAQPR